MKNLLSVISIILLAGSGFAQEFNRQDTLRGSVTPERAWWDLTYYHLQVDVDPETRTFTGSNLIQYRVLEGEQLMQIDLQPPMRITKVRQDGKKLDFHRDGNAYFVQLQKEQQPGTVESITVYYAGKPQVAKRPPWDGGVTWTKDANDKDFIATSCQGDGASLWWPCKDHMYDEVDSMMISVRAPAGLMDVSNGRLREVEKHRGGDRTYHWFVANPINNYGVNINIGDYVHFSEVYSGEKGNLDCLYYVLRDNLPRAKEQFKQVAGMLEAFEHWFGPYPFYEDAFKLVEVPYLGMEHQSSVTYGNGYQNGYRGMDLSGTGWGMKFDFIIIHEAGHEWFANNITYRDIADMWIHESFTAYSENLYLDYHYGTEAAADYTIGTRSRISNDRPIIGPYDVNQSGSGDMYYKGANMLHMIRQLVGNDEQWRSILRGLNAEFYHQTVTTEQIENYMSAQAGEDLSKIFDQYLRNSRVPVLEYQLNPRGLRYRWSNCIAGFDMRVQVLIDEEEMWLFPTEEWQELTLPAGSDAAFTVDRDFYIGLKEVD